MKQTWPQNMRGNWNVPGGKAGIQTLGGGQGASSATFSKQQRPKRIDMWFQTNMVVQVYAGMNFIWAPAGPHVPRTIGSLGSFLGDLRDRGSAFTPRDGVRRPCSSVVGCSFSSRPPSSPRLRKRRGVRKGQPWTLSLFLLLLSHHHQYYY